MKNKILKIQTVKCKNYNRAVRFYIFDMCFLFLVFNFSFLSR